MQEKVRRNFSSTLQSGWKREGASYQSSKEEIKIELAESVKPFT